VSHFYGTFNVRYTKISDTGCDVSFASSGTFELVGNASGSDVRMRINERVEREYRGGIDTNGRFSGTSSGVILTGLDIDPNHDYDGVLTGQVTGNSVLANERITFGLGCPGNVVVLEISGNR